MPHQRLLQFLVVLNCLVRKLVDFLLLLVFGLRLFLERRELTLGSRQLTLVLGQFHLVLLLQILHFIHFGLEECLKSVLQLFLVLVQLRGVLLHRVPVILQHSVVLHKFGMFLSLLL